MTERVLVIGAGISGVAAAVAARAAGHDVQVVSKGNGASAMTSGALDWTSWAEQGPPPIDPAPGLELEALARSLELELGARTLVTAAGVLRPAAGADPWLLDLRALPADATIGVVHSNWAFDRGQALLRALQADSRAAGRTFVAVAGDRLFSAKERELPLAALAAHFTPELAAQFIELARRASASGVAALLVGPYLGSDPAALDTLVRAPIPIRETTSPPEGSAGRRLDARLRALLLRDGIALEEARVAHVHAFESGARVTLVSPKAAPQRELEADRVVLAAGGLVGGGLIFGTAAGQGVTSPLLSERASTGSSFGWDGAADGGSWLRPGLGPGLRRELLDGRLIAVGDVRARAAQTLLAAAHDGLSAFGK